MDKLKWSRSQCWLVWIYFLHFASNFPNSLALAKNFFSQLIFRKLNDCKMRSKSNYKDEKIDPFRKFQLFPLNWVWTWLALSFWMANFIFNNSLRESFQIRRQFSEALFVFFQFWENFKLISLGCWKIKIKIIKIIILCVVFNPFILWHFIFHLRQFDFYLKFSWLCLRQIFSLPILFCHNCLIFLSLRQNFLKHINARLGKNFLFSLSVVNFPRCQAYSFHLLSKA